MTRMDISMNRGSTEADDHSPPPKPPEPHHAYHPLPLIAGFAGKAGFHLAPLRYPLALEWLNHFADRTSENPRFPLPAH